VDSNIQRIKNSFIQTLPENRGKLFYETSVIQIPKPERKIFQKKKKSQTNIPHENRCKNPLTKYRQNPTRSNEV